MNILLSGIVGSTAYGLAGPNSDVDRLGVFAVPTVELHGLHTPSATQVSTNPDVTYHEARKYATLALGGNPTVMELMWLPDELYDVRTDLGNELIRIRSSFLSAKRVRDAYLGYAAQQFVRLEQRADGSFSADIRNRTAKHARHLARLCYQGFRLYATGRLPIRLISPKWYLRFGDRVAGGDIEAARQLLGQFERRFDEARTVLPDRPNEEAVEQWLLAVRQKYLSNQP